MRRIIFSIILSSISLLTYAQTMNRIRIEHVGEMDKPFPIIELYSDKSEIVNTQTITEMLTMADSSVFSKVIKYFDSEFVGMMVSSDFEYGTFSVSFFEGTELRKQIYLNKEGAIYLLVNLQTYIFEGEENKIALQSMVRRLL